MSIIRDDDEERIARVEHVIEKLKPHDGELPKASEQTRVDSRAAREQLAAARRRLREQVRDSQEQARTRGRRKG